MIAQPFLALVYDLAGQFDIIHSDPLQKAVKIFSAALFVQDKTLFDPGDIHRGTRLQIERDSAAHDDSFISLIIQHQSNIVVQRLSQLHGSLPPPSSKRFSEPPGGSPERTATKKA